jgi:hypothetical protein
MSGKVSIDKYGESLLGRILNRLKSIDKLTSDELNLLGNLTLNVNPKERTPSMLRSTSNGSIPGTPNSISVANTGNTNGLFLGEILKPGETVNMDAGDINNIFAAGSLTYDATGTEFLIIYIS